MRLVLAVAAVVYLAVALLVFFASVKAAGIEGGRVAIDVFFFYLPDSWKRNMADFMFAALTT